jgi:hypothetical protein
MPYVFAISYSYEVKIINTLPTRARLDVTQYHSTGFDGTRPKEFTDKLKLDTKTIELTPGETKTISFSDAAGGFWVRWCQIDPIPALEKCGVVDLIRDTREIRLR